ncbi:MAG: transcription antitermination factor NusB [Firmicutes bacterium]|nr:transcription antitermination factor NusB [Bacillota bacterium]
MKKQSRSEAREAAFVQIFQFDGTEDIDEVVNGLLIEQPECEPNLGYITSVLTGVKEHNAELEEIISKHLSKGWTIHRISKASLVIMKLAICEMKYIDTIPPKVSINEAVELAKRYGAEGDKAFVNGLLGSVFSEL